MTNEEFLKSITLEGEMWKDVASYEGCYMVSNFGRVMSLGREVPNSDKSTRIIRPSIMSLNIIKSREIYLYIIDILCICARVVSGKLSPYTG